MGVLIVDEGKMQLSCNIFESFDLTDVVRTIYKGVVISLDTAEPEETDKYAKVLNFNPS